ncbi:hypothetical protein NDU88_003821 [Pleurodeles waltl]|uniref:Uncharacterized protein n=1 Tax=Pleurodeles waltl TaxID=8319 RepID=A0AAV7UD81_PLEWA|nr:hypothetical protein NDU88_003821 [Pleurodeles waltl]
MPKEGLAQPIHLEEAEGQWSTPKGKRKRRTRMRARPIPTQAVEERFRILLKATQFTTNPFSALREPQDSDIEQGDRSDSEDSPHGPLLTLRSADDI